MIKKILLSTLAFKRKIDDLLKKLVEFPQSKDSRYSLSYLKKEKSVTEKTSTIDVVVEPQK